MHFICCRKIGTQVVTFVWFKPLQYLLWEFLWTIDLSTQITVYPQYSVRFNFAKQTGCAISWHIDEPNFSQQKNETTAGVFPGDKVGVKIFITPSGENKTHKSPARKRADDEAFLFPSTSQKLMTCRRGAGGNKVNERCRWTRTERRPSFTAF